jgi:transcriptional regulator NrdR family protein
MPSNRRHRCNLCGREFSSFEQIRTHVERRHPKVDVRWWVVAEDPERELPFSRR